MKSTGSEIKESRPERDELERDWQKEMSRERDK